MRDFQYGRMNSHYTVMSLVYFFPNKICKKWHLHLQLLSCHLFVQQDVLNAVMKWRWKVCWELDPTLTPSVRARNPEISSLAAYIKFINGVVFQQHKTVLVRDTPEYKEIHIGMKNTNRELAVHCMFVFPTLKCQNKQKRGPNQNMN